MANVLNQSVNVGVESTYGTSVAPTRAFEAQSDVATKKVEFLESAGFIAGIKTLRSTRRQIVDMGGEGSLELDLLTNGAGMLMRGMFSTSASATPSAGVYQYTATATDVAPSATYTVQANRVGTDGTLRTFTYPGTVITGWEVSGSVGDLIKVKYDLDIRQEITSAASASLTYPASATPFNWTHVSVTVNGSAVPMKSFSLKGDLGFNTERRYLQGSALKSQPLRSSLPGYEGEFDLDYVDNTLYSLFTAGTVVSAVITIDNGVALAGSYNSKVTITLPAIQFNGETPSSSLSELTSQKLPFTVLDDGTNAPITWVYQTSDATL